MALADSSPEDAWIPKDTFGMRLVMLRKHLRASAEAIATEIGVSQPTWSMWEADASKPRNQADIVAKIAEVTGCDRNWLMWGKSATSCDYEGSSDQLALFTYAIAS